VRIKLKNLKVSEFASHETTCFEAMLNIEGHDMALVENDGQGGCQDSTLTRNKVLLRAAEKYAIAIDPHGFEQLDELVYSMMDEK